MADEQAWRVRCDDEAAPVRAAQGDQTAGSKNATHLRQRRIWSRKMLEDRVGKDDIERGIRKRQLITG